jgi:Transcriptional regulators
LAVLSGEGRITGGRGKRATVRAQPRRIRLTIDITQEQKNLVLRSASERAANGTVEMTAGIPIEQTDFLHRYDRIPANVDLAQEFAIAEGEPVLRRTYETTDKDGGLRLTWSTSYIPVSLIEENPDLLDETKEPWPGGHMHQLYTVGIEIDRMVRSITAVTPTPADRQRWGMEPGVPLMCVRSRSIDIDGRTVELSDATYPADRTDLVFTEKLRRWPKGHAQYRAEEGEQ